MKTITIMDTTTWQSVLKLAVRNAIYKDWKGTCKVTIADMDKCIIDFYFNDTPIYRYVEYNIADKMLNGVSAQDVAKNAVSSVRTAITSKYFKTTK